MTKDDQITDTLLCTTNDCKLVSIKNDEVSVRYPVKYRIEEIVDNVKLHICVDREPDGRTVGPLYLVVFDKAVHASFAAQTLYDTLSCIRDDTVIDPEKETCTDVYETVAALILNPDQDTADRLTDRLTDKYFVFGLEEENRIRCTVDKILDHIVRQSAKVKP